MTRIHLYGPDIIRMIEAVKIGKERRPFPEEKRNRDYQDALAKILCDLTDRPLPRPYPDRIVLSLDEQVFGFLTTGVCMVG